MDGAAILARVAERFARDIVETHAHRGDHTAVIRRQALLDVLHFCRDDEGLGFEMLMDLTAVDYLRYGGREDGPRFEVVYHLYSVRHNHRLRVKTRVDEDDPVVPSAVALWPIANWFEREVWDMFGVRFAGHPDPRRLLMYEEFVGHPLRKDYPIDRRQPLIGPGADVAEPIVREFMLGEGGGTGGGSQNLTVGVGPAHPAMHGIVRIVAELDGEVVAKADVEIGYLHRAFEKDCEVGGWNNAIPYTDRLNYVSPLINNFGYAAAVEKLLGIEVTERCKYIRTLMSEISRICDHLTCVGASAMELGAFTVFLYMIKAREYLWELVEAVTGARLTISYGRVGGVKADLPEGFGDGVKKAFGEVREVLVEVHRLLTGNRIFLDRMVGVGALSREETIGYAITGPLLRAVGVPYDVRRAQPHWAYDRVEFEVPTQRDGDNYARYLVRMAEMEQSMRIAEQALATIPGGAVNVDFEGREIDPAMYVDRGKQGKTDGLLLIPITLSPNLQGQDRAALGRVNAGDKRVVLPSKNDAYGSIEGLMNHFMLIMEGYGIRPPPGEAYFATEGANGELGFYVVSDGGDRPYRVRCRPPCLPPVAALHRMIEGEMIADLIPTFGSVNMIGGELDR